MKNPIAFISSKIEFVGPVPECVFSTFGTGGYIDEDLLIDAVDISMAQTNPGQFFVHFGIDIYKSKIAEKRDQKKRLEEEEIEAFLKFKANANKKTKDEYIERMVIKCGSIYESLLPETKRQYELSVLKDRPFLKEIPQMLVKESVRLFAKDIGYMD